MFGAVAMSRAVQSGPGNRGPGRRPDFQGRVQLGFRAVQGRPGRRMGQVVAQARLVQKPSHLGLLADAVRAGVELRAPFGFLAGFGHDGGAQFDFHFLRPRGSAAQFGPLFGRHFVGREGRVYLLAQRALFNVQFLFRCHFTLRR